MKHFAIFLVVACAFPFLATTMTQAQTGSAQVLTPFLMQVFCEEHPGECRPSRDAIVEWEPAMASLLSDINTEVNRDISPSSGTSRSWEINPAFGDCNDYAVTKRSRLVRHGIPAGALRIAVTRTRAGVPHAILVVRTSAGNVVLDNLIAEVKLLRRTGYAITAMSTANPSRWTGFR